VVGFIALAGVAAQTGVVMLIYLDQAKNALEAECMAQGRAFTRRDLEEAIMLGAVERVRPKMMTVVAIMAGLVPILWSTGAGSEVMQRIAVPMIGGMVSSTLLTLVVIPAIYALVKGWRLLAVDAVSQVGVVWSPLATKPPQNEERMSVMQDTQGMMGSALAWIMGGTGLLTLALVLLANAALIEYVFFR
jgi:Cu(I)/Ag(I) efflux system membrane protein CusA/SilA